MDSENQDRDSTIIIGSADSGELPTEYDPAGGQLRTYMHTKLALAGQLRVLREALTALGRTQSERRYVRIFAGMRCGIVRDRRGHAADKFGVGIY